MIRVWPDTAVRRRKFSADLGNSVLVGLGAGLVAAGVRWGLVALALALVGVAARAYFMRRASPTRILLGTQLVQRATLGSATGIALAQLTTRPAQEWPAAIVTNLLGPDPLAELRRSIKTYYLGDLPADQYAEGFLEAARGVIDGVIPVPQAAAGRGDH